MSTTTANDKQKLRLWVLPWGISPLRVQIYLKEKGIEDDFELIPVHVDENGAAFTPGKPPGSVPILEIQRATDDSLLNGRYIYQSIAILEYLEDVYADRQPNMRGATPAARAHVRECNLVLDEAINFLAQYYHQASEIFASSEPQDNGAAEFLLRRANKLFSQLETMADAKGTYLTDESDQPTIVDCVLLAAAQFSREVYSDDCTVGHPRLQRMVQAFESRASGEYRQWSVTIPPAVREMASKLSVRRD